MFSVFGLAHRSDPGALGVLSYLLLGVWYLAVCGAANTGQVCGLKLHVKAAPRSAPSVGTQPDGRKLCFQPAGQRSSRVLSFEMDGLGYKGLMQRRFLFPVAQSTWGKVKIALIFKKVVC